MESWRAVIQIRIIAGSAELWWTQYPMWVRVMLHPFFPRVDPCRIFSRRDSESCCRGLGNIRASKAKEGIHLGELSDSHCSDLRQNGLSSSQDLSYGNEAGLFVSAPLSQPHLRCNQCGQN